MTDLKAKAMKIPPRELIYAAILVVGFGYIFVGLNGVFGWGLPDTVNAVIGAVVGVAAAFGLSWLRNN